MISCGTWGDANQALIEAFTYDATGNRQSKQVGAGSPQPYAYPSDSHRLSAVDGVTRTHDAVGNLTAILSGHAHPEFEVGANNRLAAYRFNGQQQAGYVYNGQGERACKWLGSTPIRYVYDTGGRLLGEYNASGKPIAEYVYLDTLPIAVFAGSGLAYIETDHLGTPRVVVDAVSNQALWHWPLTGSAFGEHTPNEDPHGTGKPYPFNLRYPGQYFDAESGLHYNYFRDYEPGTGRYIQSDPIGLDGGISTYGYVGQRPLSLADPTGQAAPAIAGWCASNPACSGAIIKACEVTLTAMAGVAGWMMGSGIDRCEGLGRCEDDRGRCDRAADECYEECKHRLGEGGRTNQGFPYRNCWVSCMKRKGCYEGDSPVE